MCRGSNGLPTECSLMPGGRGAQGEHRRYTTVLHCTALHCTVCIALHCTVKYSAVQFSSVLYFGSYVVLQVPPGRRKHAGAAVDRIHVQPRPTGQQERPSLGQKTLNSPGLCRCLLRCAVSKNGPPYGRKLGEEKEKGVLLRGPYLGSLVPAHPGVRSFLSWSLPLPAALCDSLPPMRAILLFPHSVLCRCLFAVLFCVVALFSDDVCSFLVRDMGLDWRMGAEWFESLLLDYDPCSNYGNWTYGAGT